MNWTVTHYGDDTPLIKNDGGEICMLAKGARPEQADEIAATLNEHSGAVEEPAAPDTYTITDRVGNLVRVYAAPYADEVVWMAAQGSNQNADVEPGALAAIRRLLDDEVKRVEELESELKEWKKEAQRLEIDRCEWKTCAEDHDQRATDLRHEVSRQAGLIVDEQRHRIAAEDRLASAMKRVESLQVDRDGWKKEAQKLEGEREALQAKAYGEGLEYGQKEGIRIARGEAAKQAQEAYDKGVEEGAAIIDDAIYALNGEFFLGLLTKEDRRKKLPELVGTLCNSLDAHRKMLKPALPSMPQMLGAFRSIQTGLGAYAMVFTFKSMEDTHAADNEWLALRSALEAQK